MYSFVGIVYFSLFVIVISYDMKDDPNNEKISPIAKAHKTKATLKNTDITTKPSNNTNLPSKTVAENAENHEHERKKIKNVEKTERTEGVTPADISEEETQRTGEVTKSMDSTISSSTIEEINAAEESTAEDNNKSGTERLEDDYDDEPYLGDEDTNSPTRKTLTRNTLLDLTARGGEPFYERDSRMRLGDLDENISQVGVSPSNMRSGYVPPDSEAELPLPYGFKPADVNHYKRPSNEYSNNMPPPFHRPNGASLGPPNRLPIPRYLPPFFNTISRESIYTEPNSREVMWGQGSAPVLPTNTIRPLYFGLAPSNNQIYNAKMGQRCTGCFPERAFSRERNYRRAAETENVSANGRLLNFDPEEENAYPYVPPGEDKAPQEQFKPEARQGFNEADLPNQDLRRFGSQDDPDRNPHSKVALPYPPHLTRNNPIILNRRFGLSGLPQLFHY